MPARGVVAVNKQKRATGRVSSSSQQARSPMCAASFPKKAQERGQKDPAHLHTRRVVRRLSERSALVPAGARALLPFHSLQKPLCRRFSFLDRSDQRRLRRHHVPLRARHHRPDLVPAQHGRDAAYMRITYSLAGPAGEKVSEAELQALPPRRGCWAGLGSVSGQAMASSSRSSSRPTPHPPLPP